MGKQHAGIIREADSRRFSLGCRRRSFGGRFGALARAVIFPAMIDAADLFALHPTRMQEGAAMRAAAGDEIVLFRSRPR